MMFYSLRAVLIAFLLAVLLLSLFPIGQAIIDFFKPTIGNLPAMLMMTFLTLMLLLAFVPFFAIAPRFPQPPQNRP